MEKVLKFAIEDISKFIDDEDTDLAIADVGFLSTRKNSHNINITEPLLRKYASTILGKFLIGNLDYFESDVLSHEEEPMIFGYVPAEQEIRFKEKDGVIVASCDVVVSKLYATKFYDLFLKDNFRNTSVEMTTSEQIELPDGSLDIEWFNIHGCTVLGKTINGSCPDANISITRFSKNDADKFYHDRFNNNVNSLQKFAENRRKKMTESKTYKINKTELKDTPWGNVDKTVLRNKIMNAKNRASLVRSVYALVETGWEESPSEHLKYPLMQESDGTFYYNRYALSNALAYAKQEGEQSVISKVNNLYKKFGLDEESKEKEETKMGEEQNKLAENNEEMTENNEEAMSQQESMAEDNNDKVENKDNKEEQMYCGDQSKFAEQTEKLNQEVERNKELTAKLEEKENTIMSQEEELSKLRQFKKDTEEKEKMSVVNSTLAKIKGRVDDKAYAKYEADGKSCKFEDIQSWKNGILAEIGASVLQFSDNESDNFIRMEIPKANEKKSLWDRL